MRRHMPRAEYLRCLYTNDMQSLMKSMWYTMENYSGRARARSLPKQRSRPRSIVRAAVRERTGGESGHIVQGEHRPWGRVWRSPMRVFLDAPGRAWAFTGNTQKLQEMAKSAAGPVTKKIGPG